MKKKTLRRLLEEEKRVAEYWRDRAEYFRTACNRIEAELKKLKESLPPVSPYRMNSLPFDYRHNQPVATWPVSSTANQLPAPPINTCTTSGLFNDGVPCTATSKEVPSTNTISPETLKDLNDDLRLMLDKVTNPTK